LLSVGLFGLSNGTIDLRVFTEVSSRGIRNVTSK